MTSVLGIGILGILIVALVVAPLMMRAGRTASGAAVRATRQVERRSSAGVAAAASRSRLPLPPPSGSGSFAGSTEDEATIDTARIEGQVKASSVRKVGEIVGKHPDEALTVIRSWMNGDR